jgi:uncharacterized protein (DUF2252 family)
MVSIGRASLFYTDVNLWDGDLAEGTGVEIWGDTSWGILQKLAAHP